MRAGKKLGQYFTPTSIVKFITDKIVRDGDSVLDPACGDGAFLSYITDNFKNCRVTGIEVDSSVHFNALLKLQNHTLLNANFFSIFKHLQPNYFDCIIGNPPYIRFQKFKDDKELLNKVIKSEFDISLNGECSSWIYFTALSLYMLKPMGKLGFLVPRELLFAKYAQKLREFLKIAFDTQIYVLEDSCFPQTLQRTAILTVDKSHAHSSFNVFYMKNVNGSLAASKSSSSLIHKSWIYDRLTNSEIKQIDALKQSKSWIKLTDVVDVKASLVTGCKDFFVLSSEEMKSNHIKEKYVIECISSPTQIQYPVLGISDFNRLNKEGEKCWLLKISRDDFEADKYLQKYVAAGELKKINERYKCRIRSPWYMVSTPKIPDGFLGHLMHRYPKFSSNEAKVAVINNNHYVWLKNSNLNMSLITTMFYNTFTLLTVELLGKIYGGGNLELNPLDCSEIYIPNPYELRNFEGIFRKYSDHQISGGLVDELSKKLFRILEIDISLVKSMYDKLIAMRLRDNITSRNTVA